MAKWVSKNETIEIGGVDISHHVFAYELHANVGEVATVVLKLHDNPDLIRINGKPAFPGK